MDKSYIRHKLKGKILTHYINAGLVCPEYNLMSLIEDVKDLGNYKIIWKNDLPVKIVSLDLTHKVDVMGGLYYIYDSKGNFNQQLYSSEFISFNLKEMREYKLNKILKNTK